jgi:hypothetical protein
MGSARALASARSSPFGVRNGSDPPSGSPVPYLVCAMEVLLAEAMGSEHGESLLRLGP